MPERARIFVAEDEELQMFVLRHILEAGGHQIVCSAATFGESMRAITSFEELGINVALIDGNLSPASIDGSDGKALIAEIRRVAPAVKLVGISVDPECLEGLVDINPGKRVGYKLSKMIADL